MPNKGYKKKPPLIPSFLSPIKTRSGRIRGVRWSPQIELRNVISKADSNLKMPVEHSPLIKESEIRTEGTPSNNDITLDDELTPRHLTRSLLKQKKLDLTQTPTPTKTNNFQEERERSVLHDRTQDRERSEDESIVDRQNAEETLNEMRQFRENVVNAENIPFNRFMTQETGHPFSEDWGESEIEANLNETDGWVKSLMLQREREKHREKETDAHPFP